MVRSISLFLEPGSRPCQEDYATFNQAKGILVLADGFGGPDPGAEAAKTSCEAVREFLEREAGDDEATLPFVWRSYYSLAGNTLFNSLLYANRQLMKRNEDRNVNEKGGAAVVAGYLSGSHLALSNVGNCRAVLFREGRMAELVRPRSYRTLLSPAGVGESGKNLDAPLMALGMAKDIEPEIVEYKLRPGDWVVLHSDGVVPDAMEVIRRAAASAAGTASDSKQVAERILRELKTVEYSDNASMILAIL